MPHPELQQILEAVWADLAIAAGGEKAHPYRFAVLGTIDGSRPQVRTVVLREVRPVERLLICHTDVRSPKVSQIRTNPEVALQFYDPLRRIQLRFAGAATLHQADTLADGQWESLPEIGKVGYGRRGTPGGELPPDGSLIEDAERRREHFCAVALTVSSLDWLQLEDPHHHRARFEWTTGELHSHRLVP